ncbi:MAG: calcium/sodium antiporter [Planctomycetes bacterium]|nr:calcium/sodium antiporter [Planctomycetota bacterium]
MDLVTLGLIAGGLALLAAGAEFVVRGASGLAAAIGISPLIIGLTVVAFGTSAPELVVNIDAAIHGRSELGVGNILGSNIMNVLLILGVSAMVAPLTVAVHLIRWDVPIMIGASLAVFLLSLDGRCSRPEGILLVAGLGGYLVFLLRAGRSAGGGESPPVPGAEVPRGSKGRRALRNLAILGVGLAGLVFGARWLVEGASALARDLGVSELVIGLTVVAVGTSLPEVFTSVVASIRGERDIAVGNVIGSNIFNLLGVFGITALCSPGGLEVSAAALRFDMPVMLATAFACFPVFFIGSRVSRREGALFLGYYAAYLTYLVLASADHDALPAYSAVMLLFVLPLTGAVIGVLFLRAVRSARA